MFLSLAVLLAGAAGGNLGVACDSGEDVGPGGTCFLAMDCKEGLFCLRQDGSDNGTCTGTSGLTDIQPAADGALDGAGNEPMPGADAAPEEEAAPSSDSGTGPDARKNESKDAQTPDHAAPEDTGAPPLDTGTPDSSPADTGSATNG
jgi:hypothetical protein